MTVCSKCKFYNICKGRLNETVENCVRFKSVEMTNEEWRKTCSEEEFAEALTKVVLDLIAWNNDPKPSEVRNILKSWLKQQHIVKE